MIDPHFLRDHPDQVKQQLARRGVDFDVTSFSKIEEQRKAIQIKTQTLQNERNAKSKAIGQAKAQGEDIQPLLDNVQSLGDKLKDAEQDLVAILSQINTLAMGLPNILDDSVPAGVNEANNQEISRWGNVPEFSFAPKDHVELGENLGMLDFGDATKIAKGRFSTLCGSLAKLHRALIQFMLDTHTQEHGYQEIYVPYLVNADSMRGTGQLPKFEQDLFKVNSDPELYLIPTAEVPVTNLVRDVIIEATKMPLKWVCHTPCFRSEAGSYGQDVRGLIRQHQFEKVELVQIVKSADSIQALEELTGHAEQILQKLRLPYRKVLLCAGDTGFSSSKTYDLEVWLPGQNNYREISSCSIFKDFQARRMKARWRDTAKAKPELVHTLNGSGLAVGRTLIAIMENYQDVQGNIVIPEILHPLMGGIKEIAGS